MSHIEGKGSAYVVAVSMGYGHERAANALVGITGKEGVLLANDYKGMPAKDKQVWHTSREWYERISRFKKVPILGQVAFGVMDEIQEIQPFYPRRDLSQPSLQLRQIYRDIQKKQMCKHLIETLAKDPRPLVCTFMTPAFAAEEFDYPDDIYLVLCDADVNRAWAPMNPRRTRIQFFAPTGRVVERLKLYGVPEKNIHFTGFPLPPTAVGSLEATAVKANLSRRLCNLDPQGVFAMHARVMLEAVVGAQFCAAVGAKKPTPLSLTFAVGGAGAQREIGITLAESLSKDLGKKRIVLNLVAGTRPEINTYFVNELTKRGLDRYIKQGSIRIHYSEKRADYFKGFTKLMGETDVLWTKPSELSFYVGLGIPMIMSEPVGSQEEFNRSWLFQVGAGADALDPKYAHEWLFDWVEGGALARMAWNGFTNAPTHGAYRIADAVSDQPWSIHPLPLVV
jgi:hypothetical protein